MKEWLTAREIADLGLEGLPTTKRNVNALATRERWRDQPGKSRVPDRQGGAIEYHVSVLPGPAQARLLALHGTAANENSSQIDDSRNSIWTRVECLSIDHKQTGRDRLAVMNAFEALCQSGQGRTAAARLIAKRNSIAVATLHNWLGRLAGVDRSDRLAALAPGYKGRRDRSECDPRAYAGWYNATGTTLYVLGMLVSAFAVRALVGQEA